MEKAGTWEDTTILVTSDHGLRREKAITGSQDRPVPFLLRLAGHSEPIRYDSAFNTVVVHDLILACLGREFSDARAAVRWMDDHRLMLQNHKNQLQGNLAAGTPGCAASLSTAGGSVSLPDAGFRVAGGGWAKQRGSKSAVMFLKRTVTFGSVLHWQ